MYFWDSEITPELKFVLAWTNQNWGIPPPNTGQAWPHGYIAIAKIKPNRGICKFLSTNLWKLKLKLSTLNFSLPPAILVDPPRYRHNFSMAKRRPRFLPVRTRLQRYLFSLGLSVARATIVKNWTAFPCLHSKLKLLAKLGLSEYKVSLLRRNP